MINAAESTDFETIVGRLVRGFPSRDEQPGFDDVLTGRIAWEIGNGKQKKQLTRYFSAKSKPFDLLDRTLSLYQKYSFDPQLVGKIAETVDTLTGIEDPASRQILENLISFYSRDECLDEPNLYFFTNIIFELANNYQFIEATGDIADIMGFNEWNEPEKITALTKEVLEQTLSLVDTYVSAREHTKLNVLKDFLGEYDLSKIIFKEQELGKLHAAVSGLANLKEAPARIQKLYLEFAKQSKLADEQIRKLSKEFARLTDVPEDAYNVLRAELLNCYSAKELKILLRETNIGNHQRFAQEPGYLAKCRQRRKAKLKQISPTALAKRLALEDDEAVDITITYKNGKAYRFHKQDIDVLSRNHVEVFEDEDIQSIIKVYPDKTNGLAEAFWLEFFDGKIPLKQLISSESYDGVIVNQIEKSKGPELTDALANVHDKKEKFEDAIMTLVEMYKLIAENPDYVKESLDRIGYDYSLGRDYFKQRFDELEQRLMALQGNKDVDQSAVKAVLEKMPEYRQKAEVLRDNITGIIPYDYAPRNMVLEDRFVPLDHECYKQGHPITAAVTLIKNPENDFSKELEQYLLHFAVYNFSTLGVNSPQEVIEASNIFWNARQARVLAKAVLKGDAAKQDVEHLNWYLNDMRGVA